MFMPFRLVIFFPIEIEKFFLLKLDLSNPTWCFLFEFLFIFENFLNTKTKV